MPVTINLNDHPATGWKSSRVDSGEKLFQVACPSQHGRSQRIVQSSFSPSLFGENHTSASTNGFVWAAYHAYSSHHNLVLRPEDVWFAILTQMSFFINAHAEELRSFFVAHDGKKELTVFSDIADFGALARDMTHMIAKNVLDPELRDWVMPSFTTTTHHDKVVGAVLFMGAMQKYFSFGMCVSCGIPSVTLLGEVEDWKEIQRRLDKLDQFGHEEPSLFAKMLRPILSYMVMCFEQPNSWDVVHFWNTIVHRNHLGSGTDYLTGWLTTFCFWDEQGKPKAICRENLFGDVSYPSVDVDDIPKGYATVPVKVNDRGHKYEATMVAGSVGITARGPSAASPASAEGSQSNSSTDDGTVVLDTVQPLSGWWMYGNEAASVKEERAAELARLQEQLDSAWDPKREKTDFVDISAIAKRIRELEIIG